MPPTARAAPRPATAPARVFRGSLRRIASVAACSQSGLISGSPQTKGAADRSAAPCSLERISYFRLVIAVRSAESLTIPVAPHQLEPKPPGLMAVTKLGLK